MTPFYKDLTNKMMTYNDDMPIYISIYDKPKRGKGRPLTCTLTDEEKAERKRIIALKHYYEKRGEGRPLSCKLTDEEKAERKIIIALKHYYDNYEDKCVKNTIYREKQRNKLCNEKNEGF